MPALSYTLIFISMQDKGESQRACYMCFCDGHMSLQNSQPLRIIALFSGKVISQYFLWIFQIKTKGSVWAAFGQSKTEFFTSELRFCSLSTFYSPWTEPWNTHANCIWASQRNTTASSFQMLTSYSLWILLWKKNPTL